MEAADSVPWTKPDELVVDPKKPLPKLGGSLPDAFLALVADGSVHMIPQKIDEQILRYLIDPRDGNVIDWEKIEKARDRKLSRPSGVDNLKQIGFGMHAYHDLYGYMPSAASCDKAGKPLLSWRVAILPYIEQGNLYRQFKLDEPWNSEHNMKLLALMPPQYAVPNHAAKKGETYLRVFVGPNTPFNLEHLKPGTGPRMVDFVDGLSNTLLVVEAAESVPWTKPDELVVDPKKPLPKLGGSLPNAFFAVFADASVHEIPQKIDERTLRNLIDPRDGNVVDWDPIEKPRDRKPRRTSPAQDGEPVKP